MMYTNMLCACVLALIALRTYSTAVFSTLAMVDPAMARKVALRILSVERYTALLASEIADRKLLGRIHRKRRPWSGGRKCIYVTDTSTCQQTVTHLYGSDSL